MTTTSAITVTTTERRAVLSALSRCMEAAMDTRRGYAAAASAAHDPDLEALLEVRSDQRAEFVKALQRAVAELGGWPHGDGSVEGALHLAWAETQLANDPRSDLGALVECERVDRAALAAYDTALWFFASQPSLPDSVRSMIAKQRGTIRASLVDTGKRLVGAD